MKRTKNQQNREKYLSLPYYLPCLLLQEEHLHGLHLRMR